MLDPDIFIAFNYEKRQLDMDPLENTPTNNFFLSLHVIMSDSWKPTHTCLRNKDGVLITRQFDFLSIYTNQVSGVLSYEDMQLKKYIKGSR